MLHEIFQPGKQLYALAERQRTDEDMELRGCHEDYAG